LARPRLVTAAAIVLYGVGSVQILFGLFALGGAALVAGSGLGGALVMVGLIAILMGVATIYAGLRAKALREDGRRMGLVVSALAGVLISIGIITQYLAAIVGLIVFAYGFVIYALVTTSEVFRRA
jgi:hypothetical protein